MDNLAIARVFGEIGDLLEIKAENPFKIRAYRNAADTIAHLAEPIAEPPGADRLANSRASARTSPQRSPSSSRPGAIAYHQELLQEFPPTILDLLHLQGVGPKTVALLYRELGIRHARRSRAARRATAGSATLKGMGAKKEALILKALEERARFAGRRLMAEAHDTAAALVAALRDHAPDADISPVGSLRRGCETCGDLDILAAGAPPSLMDAFTGYRLVERVLAHGETKSSVLLWGGFQADLRLVPARASARRSSTSPARRRTTSRSATARIQRGLKLNEYGLFRVDDERDRSRARPRKRSTRRSGLAFIAAGAAREPRRDRGRRNADAAAAHHAGTICAATCTCTRRRPTAAPMRRRWRSRRARAGPRLHRHHRPQPGARDGQRPRRARGRSSTRGAIRALNDRLDGHHACSPASNATSGPTARWTSPTTASPSSTSSSPRCTRRSPRTRAQMTDRLLRAIACPWVDMLGHPTGRLHPQARAGYASTSIACSPRPPPPAWRSRSTARSIASTSTSTTPGWRAIAASSS